MISKPPTTTRAGLPATAGATAARAIATPTASATLSACPTYNPQINVAEQAARAREDLVVERRVLDLMNHPQYLGSIQVIDGLVPGNLTRALNGEHVGTIITA